MAASSTPMPAGTLAPDFQLPDTVSGNTLSLDTLRGQRGTVVMFICNHCPYVVHVQQELVRLANDYRARGVAFVAICANDAERYPDDAPERMREEAHRLGYPFPYLHDETQSTARAYDAVCTPDIYLFDKDLRLTYRGQLDDSRPRNDVPVTGSSLRAALDATIAGQPVEGEQKASVGCSIKWRE